MLEHLSCCLQRRCKPPRVSAAKQSRARPFGFWPQRVFMPGGYAGAPLLLSATTVQATSSVSCQAVSSQTTRLLAAKGVYARWLCWSTSPAVCNDGASHLECQLPSSLEPDHSASGRKGCLCQVAMLEHLSCCLQRRCKPPRVSAAKQSLASPFVFWPQRVFMPGGYAGAPLLLSATTVQAT